MGEKLKSLRIEKKLTQKQVADRIGLAISAVSSYESGTRYPSYDVLVNGDYFKIDILDELKKVLRDRVSKGLQGRQVIAAQMPGIVTQVMVKEGQEVEEGQPLLILVAMKMENQIKAPKAGVVQNVYVEANQTVAIGDKLAVIE